jgi:spore maturation protein CgeB
MYQCLSDSQAVLNIHADSSPLHASNMRLFETTGIGTCLVTDWRQNINELFIEDEEVVTYRSIEDCVNKLKWLMNNPLQAEKIAERGQHRTLRDHTYDVRSTQLLEIIHKAMK